MINVVLTLLTSFMIHISWLTLLSFIHFVADDTAYGGTDGSPSRTATRKYCTADGAGSSADGCILILARHVRTATQTEQHGNRNCTWRESLYGFHMTASF
jgi:hypothetical protein